MSPDSDDPGWAEQYWGAQEGETGKKPHTHRENSTVWYTLIYPLTRFRSAPVSMNPITQRAWIYWGGGNPNDDYSIKEQLSIRSQFTLFKK